MAGASRGEHEGERAPEPHPAVADAAPGELLQRQRLAERADRRPAGAAQRAQQQERPELGREREQRDPDHGRGGQPDHQRLAAAQAVGLIGDREVGRDPRPERRRQHEPDLRGGQALLREPDRPERQLDADRGKGGAVEQRQAGADRAGHAGNPPIGLRNLAICAIVPAWRKRLREVQPWSVAARRSPSPTPGAKLLAARLDLPVGAPRALALFAHCFTCSKDVFAATRISQRLAERGLAVLRFDFTGLGASEGEFANTNFSSNLDDLVAAADFLRNEHQAPKLLVGHSLGGAAVLAAAHRVPEAVAVATIAAPADPAHVGHLLASARAEIEAQGEALVTIAGRSFRVQKQFLDDIAGAPARRTTSPGSGRR